MIRFVTFFLCSVLTAVMFLSTSAKSGAVAPAFEPEPPPADACECEITTMLTNVQAPLDPCVGSFGITLTNQVKGKCHHPACNDTYNCTATVTMTASSAPGQNCEWGYSHPYASGRSGDPTLEEETSFDEGCNESSHYSFYVHSQDASQALVGTVVVTCEECSANL